MSFAGYTILETDNGPMISDSRTSIYDVLLSHNEGEDIFAICVIHNLKLLQVEVALKYIEENRERLEAALPRLMEIKAERERHYRAIAEEKQKIIDQLPMTPERAAFYALREKNSRVLNENGNSYSE